MADARTTLSTVLYCIWWPFSHILSAARAILSPFWALAQFVFLPVVYLVQGLLAIVLLPFRLHVLERIETIYIWLGVASLIGCITGAVLFIVFKFLSSALHIDGSTSTNKPAAGRTVREYRVGRRAKRVPLLDRPSHPSYIETPGLHRRGLSSRPILEEDSDF